MYIMEYTRIVGYFVVFHVKENVAQHYIIYEVQTSIPVIHKDKLNINVQNPFT